MIPFGGSERAPMRPYRRGSVISRYLGVRLRIMRLWKKFMSVGKMGGMVVSTEDDRSGSRR